MNALDLMKELAALGGYSITGNSTQEINNKARALRRLNQVRADIISRFSGRWQANYREGWLPLEPLYNTGTITLTRGSRTVTGSGTAFSSAMEGRKLLTPSNEYYRISYVASTTSLTLTEPYQGADVTDTSSWHIWKDEYTLYPNVFSVLDFLNYSDPNQMAEDFTKHARMQTARPTSSSVPRIYTILGRKHLASYSTGTVSGTAGSNVLTGVATSWLGNVYPGYKITIGAYTYEVQDVHNNTQLVLCNNLVTSPSGSTYSATGHNALIVRFNRPTEQLVVSYGYFAKCVPLVADTDEDWLCEMFPNVILDGVMKYDYLDKNDPVRAGQAVQIYENAIHNAHTADSTTYGGTYVVGLDIPDAARE